MRTCWWCGKEPCDDANFLMDQRVCNRCWSKWEIVRPRTSPLYIRQLEKRLVDMDKALEEGLPQPYKDARAHLEARVKYLENEVGDLQRRLYSRDSDF